MKRWLASRLRIWAQQLDPSLTSVVLDGNHVTVTVHKPMLDAEAATVSLHVDTPIYREAW